MVLRNLGIDQYSFVDAKNLAVSFYLYHISNYKRLQVRLTINGEIIEYMDLNASAYEAWQKVVIPFERPSRNIATVRLEIFSGTNPVDVLISNLRIIKSERSAMYFDNGGVKFKDFSDITLSKPLPIDNVQISDNRTNNELFITEADIIKNLTLASKKSSKDPKDIYVCNGKKMLYGFTNIKSQYNNIQCTLVSGNNLLSEGVWPWYIQTDSVDGKTITKKYVEFGVEADVAITKVTQNNITSTTTEKYNKFGQPISKIDEHGVETKYEYFDNGNVKRVSIYAGGKELRVYEATADSEEFVTANKCGYGSEAYEYIKSHGLLDKL